MKLKISFSNHLQALKFHIGGTFLMLVALYFFNFDKISLIVFFCVWVLYTLPTLYLHFKYYHANKGQAIIITNNEIVLSYCYKVDSDIFRMQDIEKIVLCRSASMDKGGMPITPIETYQHIKIFLKTGAVINITNLMTPHIDNVLNYFKGIRFIREKGVFCLFNL